MIEQFPLRFRQKIVVSEQGCWLWEAGKKPGGYGVYTTGTRQTKKTWNAHIYAFEFFYGPVPDGLELDHLCRIRHCVNPEHLEAVTRKINLRRGNGFTGQKARQTACINGHPFTDANTYIRTNGTRCCRRCRNYRAQRAHHKTRRHLEGAVTPDFTGGGDTL
jgi:hypothetical protein